MSMRKIVTVGIVALMGATAVMAADPGGTPGLVKAIFKGSAFNTTSDVMANALGYTIVPEEMYASSLGEKTTVAWAGYMYMTGGVKYNFKGCYDDYVQVKIAGGVVVSQGSECQERTGSYTPAATDWYKIEFRVANNGAGGGCQNSSQYGILWSVEGDTTWRKVLDYGDGSLFKTGKTGLSNLQKREIPFVLSSKMRKSDKTIMDVTYIVASSKSTANVRALAFQDGERSFWKVIKPKTFVKDEDGINTSGNIGDGVPANKVLHLAWKVPSDWDIDIAKVKFEILTSEMAQLPMKTMTIPATAKNPAMTIAVNAQTDADIFNALLWYWANGVTDLLNPDGYLSLDHPYPNQVDTTNVRLVNRTTIANRPEALRYLYKKMGWEPLEGGNLMNYVRQATRKDIWFNSGNQTCAIKTSTKPANLYIGEKAYCVIDVSGGKDAASYPVSYLDTEPVNGWGDEYKTTKILLRRVEAGKFMMQNNKDVTLTKPFYMGVFTVTQKQYEQVMGTNPTQSDHRGAMRPVEISWNAIRGDSATYKWPTVKTVDPATFVGKIQAKTGLNFDLPTEAQWECACRAGTSSWYNNGGGDVGGFGYDAGRSKDLSLLGRFGTSDSASVGLFLPNMWGIYDMHGNVGQWCLDLSAGWNQDPCIDPFGPTTGSSRVVRGYGRWNGGNGDTVSNSLGRFDASPGWGYTIAVGTHTPIGFRLSRTLAE